MPQDCKRSQQCPVPGDRLDHPIELRRTAERLGDDKSQHAIGSIEQKLRICCVPVGGCSGKPLHDAERKKRCHGQIKRIGGNLQLAVNPMAESPCNQHHHGTSFQGKDGPGLDRSKGKRRRATRLCSPRQAGENRSAGAWRLLRRARVRAVRPGQNSRFVLAIVGIIGRKLKIVEPELTSNWASGREALDDQAEQGRGVWTR